MENENENPCFWIYALILGATAWGYAGYLLVLNGVDYEEMTWSEIADLPANMGQSVLFESDRGKFVRLTGWVNPYQTIKIVSPPDDKSCVLLASLNDPAYASWLDAKERIEDYDRTRLELAKFDGDKASEEALTAEVNELRNQMKELQEQRETSPGGEYTPEAKLVRDRLARDLQRAFDTTPLNQTAVSAAELQSRLVSLCDELSRRPDEWISSSHIFLIYHDGGEFSEQAQNAISHPIINALRINAFEMEQLGQLMMGDIRDQMLWILPVSNELKEKRKKLDKSLEKCEQLCGEIIAVLPEGVAIEGFLRPASAEVRDKFKELSKRDSPHFILDSGISPADGSGWTWAKLGTGALIVAAVLKVVGAWRRRRRSITEE